MGVVYRAYDTRITREVALKTIQLDGRAEPGEVEQLRARLIREAQSAGRLSHPGIVTIFDADEQGGLAYVAMELVQGRRLSEYFAEGIAPADKLPFATALLKMAGSALDYASHSGVVHRDVKPANIIVSDGQFKLLDFGVARISSSQLTQAGTVVGTPNYMSPEQVSGERVDGRSDQFALAVIIYELLTGHKPFAARSVPSTLYKIVHEDPQPIHTKRPGIPREVERVVSRALSKDPADRFMCCSDFADAFQKAAEGRSPLWDEVEISLEPGEPTETALVTGESSGRAEVLPAPGFDPGLTLTVPGGSQTATEPAGAPVLPPPAKEDSTKDLSPPGLEESRPPRRSVAGRWTSVALAMLACAIGAGTVVLVRYPELVRDRQEIGQTLLAIENDLLTFGRELADLFEPEPGVAPTTVDPTPSPAPAPPQPASEEPPQPAGMVRAEPSEQPQADTDPNAAEAAGVQKLPELDSSNDSPERTVPGRVQPGQRAGLAAPTTSAILFESNVEGVLVTIDSDRSLRCITPCRLSGIPFGEHNLLAHRSGYGLQRRTIEVTGAEMKVEVIMSRPEATLVVSSRPTGAKIFVDGVDTGKITNSRIDVRAGHRSIRLEHGELSAEQAVNVKIAELRHLDFRLARR